MKYILAFMCLIVAIVCYVKPELLSNTNMVFGSIFMCLADLFFKKKDEY